MGILIHLVLAVVHVLLIVVDALLLLLAVRSARRRWPSVGWLVAIDDAGRPLLNKFYNVIAGNRTHGMVCDVACVLGLVICRMALTSIAMVLPIRVVVY